MGLHDLREFEHMLRKAVKQQKLPRNNSEEEFALYSKIATLVAECLEHSHLVTFFDVHLDADTDPESEGMKAFYFNSYSTYYSLMTRTKLFFFDSTLYRISA